MFVMLMCLASMAQTLKPYTDADSPSSYMAGTKVYKITSAKKLFWLKQLIEGKRTDDDNYAFNSYKLVSFEITDDIDMQASAKDGEIMNWEPIQIPQYMHIKIYVDYNKRYHIKNLYINEKESKNYIGLFSKFEDTEIAFCDKHDQFYRGYTHDLSKIPWIVFDNAQIYAPNSKYVGVFAGYVHSIYFGNLEKRTADLIGIEISKDSRVTGGDYTGGLVGYTTGTVTIKCCTNNATVTGKDYTGGIAGYCDRSTDINHNVNFQVNNTNYGDITGHNYVGGLFGYHSRQEKGDRAIGLANYGDVNGWEHVGGIAGELYVEQPTIGVYNKGNVTGRDYVTGVIGTCAYNRGNVTCTNGEIAQLAAGDNSFHHYASKLIIKGKEQTYDATLERSRHISGEVTYELSKKYHLFGQKIGYENEPTYSFMNKKDTVWANILYHCSGQIKIIEYTNDKGIEQTLEHCYQNGTCLVCGDTQAGYDPVPVVRHISNYNEFISAMGYVRINNKVKLYLDADIDLTPYYNDHTTWEPVGTKERPFKGSFYGQGHKIKNLRINTTSSQPQGLFGVCGRVTFKDLTFEDVNIDAQNSSSVGTLVGFVDEYFTRFDHINVIGNSIINGGVNTGGIFGETEDDVTIKHCSNAATITGRGITGGICGKLSAHTKFEVTYCVNTGDISHSEKDEYGLTKPTAHNTCGICGYAYSPYGDKENMCANYGKIDGYWYPAYGISNAKEHNGNLSAGAVYYQGEKKSAQFSRDDLTYGAAAYSLKNLAGGDTIWVQQLGVDPYPRLSINAEDSTLYRVGEEVTRDCTYAFVSKKYKNGIDKNVKVTKHYYDERSVCTICGGGSEPKLINGSYRISNLGELLWYNKHYRDAKDDNERKTIPDADLIADIDMEGVTSSQWRWQDNRGNSVVYYGNFNGHGHTIYNSSTSFVNRVAGNISNLTINGIIRDYAGMIAVEQIGGTIENCVTYGSVRNNHNTGGIVGKCGGVIRKCVNHCTVESYKNSANYGSEAGGIAGSVTGKIELCENTGSIDGQNGAGGIAGYVYSSGEIRDVTVYGDLTIESGSTYYKSAGGIAGYCEGRISNALVRDCTVEGAPIVHSCGSDAVVEKCYYCRVSATKNDFGDATPAIFLINGKVTFDLQDMRDEIVWSQILRSSSSSAEEYPVLNIDGKSNNRVVANRKIDCQGNYSSSSYLNGTDYSKVTNLGHQYDATGHCSVCGLGRPIDKDEDGYYLIDDIAQLEWFRDEVNHSPLPYVNMKARLTSTINMSAVYGPDKKSWEPIGSGNKVFSGEFDGCNQLIESFYYNNPNNTEHGGGLFGNLENATIKNIYGFNGTSNTNGGGLIAYQAKNTTFYNVRNGFNEQGEVLRNDDGTNIAVIAGTDEGGAIGGLVGTATDCDFNLCINNADVSSGTSVGGLVGRSMGGNTFEDCGNYATVSGNTAVGGLVGYSENSDIISHCLTVGSVTAETDDYGLLIGLAQNGMQASKNYALAETPGIEHNNEGLILASNEQMESGQIAYEINDGRKNERGNTIWGQVLANRVKVPFIGRAAVYPQHYCNCMLEDVEETYYSNTEAGGEIRHADGISPKNTYCPDNETDYKHVFVDGKCKYCEGNLKDIVAPRGGHHLENGICVYCHLALDEPEKDEDGYYLIGNAGELLWFADNIELERDKPNKARQIADIDLSDVCHPADAENGIEEVSWTPIGWYGAYFHGEYDGQDHKITGLYINSNNAGIRHAGLFSQVGFNGTYTDASVISNLTVEGNVTSDVYTGMIAGRLVSSSRVENCVVRGKVKGSEYCVGGIVGYCHVGYITDCINEADVLCTGTNTNGTSSAGGIAGIMNGSATRCMNYGTVNAIGNGVGGICGRCNTPNEVSLDGNLLFVYPHAIADCGNVGEVYGNSMAGGIVGVCEAKASISNSWNSALVKVNEGGTKVGFANVGESSTATITNCYYDATLNGSDDANATSMSTTDFRYGRVAYVLDADRGDKVWGQDLENGEYNPTLGGPQVYRNLLKTYDDYSSQGTDIMGSSFIGNSYEMPAESLNKGVYVSFDWTLNSLDSNYGSIKFSALSEDLYDTSALVPEQSAGTDNYIFVKNTSSLNAMYDIPSSGDFTLDDNYCTLTNVKAWRFVNTPYSPGDVNNDGTVDTLDLTILTNYILGIDSLIQNFDAADLNGDGYITIGDASKLIELMGK